MYVRPRTLRCIITLKHTREGYKGPKTTATTSLASRVWLARLCNNNNKRYVSATLTYASRFTHLPEEQQSLLAGSHTTVSASSPGHSHLFNVARRKGRGPGIRCHVINVTRMKGGRRVKLSVGDIQDGQVAATARQRANRFV